MGHRKKARSPVALADDKSDNLTTEDEDHNDGRTIEEEHAGGRAIDVATVEGAGGLSSSTIEGDVGGI